MAKLNHHFIRGTDGNCYWNCGHRWEEHPQVIDRPPTVRRPARIDQVQGGWLPKFKVQS